MPSALIRGPVLHGIVLGGLVLAVCGMAGLAEAPAPSAPAGPSGASNGGASSMRFAVVAEGPSEACAPKCRLLVSASGMITADTHRQFMAFVRDNGLPGSKAGVPGATVVLESDGGSVLGALDLGRAIRRLGFATTVGRVVEGRARGGMRYGEVAARADCQSMCPFVLLGGVQREVPPAARVLVHQIWLGDRRDDAVAAGYTAEDLMVVQRDIGSILRYTVEMGGDIELLTLSLRAPPWEPMHVLTRDEMRRTRLDLPEGGEVAANAMLVHTAAGPVPGEDDGPRLAGERGWASVARDGRPALARSHPLTVDGERIGSFDLSFACGSAQQTYILTYRETRTGSRALSAPRSVTRIAVAIDDDLQPLDIAASDRRLRRGEVDSIASAVLPERLVKSLAADASRSMTLETESTGNPRTVTRVGNAGFERNFHDLEKACAQTQPNRADARAHVELRSPAQ